MSQHIFLVEIGTEELPSKILQRLGYDFANHISNELKRNNINCIEVCQFVSLRHLAVKSTIQMDDKDFFALFVDKLNNCNIHDVSHVTNTINNQNKTLNCSIQKRHEYIRDIENNYDIHSLLCQVVSVALSKLENYEMMRWGGIETVFIRPVHTVTILLDMYLIKGCFFGINTDRVLYGHPLMENNRIIIKHADDYPDILFKQGRIIVDYNRRKEIIRIGVQKEAKKIGGVVNIEDDNLLDEVTSLVEWPVILSGKFDEKFLNLPNEVVHHIMQSNQRYFPVYSVTNSMLMPFFIFVVNVITEDYAPIVAGYENVIKPRLMDAEFFFNKDQHFVLEDYAQQLDSVLFHRKLGTLRDKSYRISTLSGWIAAKIGEDVQQTERAGYLCKCDLVSNMVLEFPVTQGIIGMYYARRDGESEKVALAQKEHYNPKFNTDVLPTTLLSCAVAIADKIDTISGIFGIKVLPKGNRDPFALKRSAFGILRILIQKKISLNLSDLIEESIKLYTVKLTNITVVKDIHLFMYQRLYLWYCAKKFKKDIIKAVLAIDYFNVLNVDMRMHAVNAFYSKNKKEGNIFKLCFIYKRILNFIKDKPVFLHEDLQNISLKFPIEIQLVNQIILLEEKINFLLKEHDYYKVLELLVTIFDPVNKFFDHVVIMDKNVELQKNRFILLNKINNLFLQIMDFSLLDI